MCKKCISKYYTGFLRRPIVYSVLALLGALGNPSSQGSSMWSLSEYKERVQEGEDTAGNWDELERSIIANIADDISVGILGDRVEMIVSKRF